MDLREEIDRLLMDYGLKDISRFAITMKIFSILRSNGAIFPDDVVEWAVIEETEARDSDNMYLSTRGSVVRKLPTTVKDLLDRTKGMVEMLYTDSVLIKIYFPHLSERCLQALAGLRVKEEDNER
ncbi:MAG: hypothetical protein PHY29_02990 [Syntrophales bacterium]|nr:hypothetical protein [Syntrophales bacterium]